MWSGNFKSAMTTLRQSKWRSFLTMLGVIIGVSSVITVVSLGEGLKHQIVGQINNLGSNTITVRSGKLVNTKNNSLNLLAFFNSSTLTSKDLAAIGKLPSVKDVVPIDFVTNSVKSDNGEIDNVFVIGTTPNLTNVLNQKVNYGDFFANDEFGQNNAVIGSAVAEQLFNEINPVGRTITINGKDFLVSGVLEPSSGGLLSIAETDFNQGVFIPLPIAQTLTNGQVNLLQILARSSDSNPDAAINDIKKTLTQTHNGSHNFTVLKQYELLNLTNGVLNIFTAFITGIAAISLLVGGIGIMDIMLVSVSERTREIGVRKAVGATDRQIKNQFLVEGLTLTLAGGFIGILLALLISVALRLYTNLQPMITIWVVLLAVGVSVGVGVIFSVVPALKAAHKNPIDALRGE